MPESYLSITSHSPEETEAFASQLADRVTPGDLIVIIGTLGAGKTTFVRGFMRSIGFRNSVRSPSFTMANRYPSSPPVSHLDLYRMKEPSELLALDLENERRNRIVFVEWGDRLDAEYLQATCEIRIDLVEGKNTWRSIRIEQRG